MLCIDGSSIVWRCQENIFLYRAELDGRDCIVWFVLKLNTEKHSQP